MEQLEGFAKPAEGIAARESGLPAEGVEYAIRARERPRMAMRGTRRRGRAAGL